MKKILLFVLVALFSFTANAQHFTFRDIEIDGTVEEMGAKLTELGYTATESPLVYTGQFIGENCTIFLFSSDYVNLVHSVVVQFEAESRWASLKSDYFEIKELCTSKYGEPSKSMESFDRPYYEGDGYEISAVKQNKSNYHSKWDLDNGNIMMTITSDATILLVYTDSANEALDEQAKQKTAESQI